MHGPAAEPQRRSLGAERLGLEGHLLEPVVPALERRGRVTPQRSPGRQVIVQELAPLLERRAERLVLGTMPADRGLDDQASLRHQIYRRELLGQQQRMPERRDDGARDQAEPRCGRGDGGEQGDRIRPRGGGVLVAGQRVRAGILGDAPGISPATQYHVLAQHHGVEPGGLRIHGGSHEAPQVSGRPQCPVLGQDQDEAGRDPAPPIRHAYPRRSDKASLAGSRPLTTSM